MTVNKEEQMIKLLLEAYDIAQSRISVGDIVVVDNMVYIDRSKEFRITPEDPVIHLSGGTSLAEITKFLKENGKNIGNGEDSYYQWIKMLLSSIKKKKMFIEDNLKLRSKALANEKKEKLDKLKQFSEELYDILEYINNGKQLHKFVGKTVMLKVKPYFIGNLKATYIGCVYHYLVVASTGDAEPVRSLDEISLVNELRLRPFYNDAETMEEKLLGVIIDSSWLINKKVNALGVTVDGNTLHTRTFSGVDVAACIEFSENSTTQELYEFVSKALLYRDISIAFIKNCEGNVLKSFKDNPIEAELVKEWFNLLVKEYKKYISENDIIETKQFIIDILNKQLELEKESVLVRGFDESQSKPIAKLKKAIALTEKEMNR